MSQSQVPLLCKRFASNLKRERMKRRLSQEEVAAKAGISTSYVSMLERGQRSPPLSTLEELAKAFGIKPIALLQ
jgi:transcriptional regulator with XRE-family HTH domain